MTQRLRVTVHSDRVELRGYFDVEDFDELLALADAVKPFGLTDAGLAPARLRPLPGHAIVIETRVVLDCTTCLRTGDRTVRAWEEPGVPGLALHQMHVHTRHDAVVELARRSWVVSHLTGVGGGAVVVGAAYSHRAQAEHALLALGRLNVDWRLPADDPRFRDPVLVDIMVGIVEEAQGMEINLDL